MLPVGNVELGKSQGVTRDGVTGGKRWQGGATDPGRHAIKVVVGLHRFRAKPRGVQQQTLCQVVKKRPGDTRLKLSFCALHLGLLAIGERPDAY